MKPARNHKPPSRVVRIASHERALYWNWAAQQRLILVAYCHRSGAARIYRPPEPNPVALLPPNSQLPELD